MTKVIDQFIKDMEIRNLSPRTRTAYLRAIQRLSRFYQGRAPETLSDQEVQDFIHHQAIGRGLSWSYVKIQTAAFRFFYGKTMRLAATCFVIPVAKSRVKLPQVLTRDEMRRVFQTVAYDLRKTAYFSLLYGCGLRGAEACNLRLTDIESASWSLRILNGKGGKDRVVYLPKKVYHDLAMYWKACRFKDYLFTTRHNPSAPMDIKIPQGWYKALSKEANIHKQGCLHLFRHSYATHALEDGIGLLSIQKNLGHTSLKSTMIYLQLAQIPEPTQAPIDRLFPKTETVSFSP